MARLNELQTAPIESLDALKRRFVRQNREIAKANSTQSLRIRNLESETSRLLAENISLREQVIKLEHELEVGGRFQLQTRFVESIRSKLEDKLSELGGLLGELGSLQSTKRVKELKGTASGNRRSSSSSPSHHRQYSGSPKRSPDQRNWKNALTLSEVTYGGQQGQGDDGNGRLPAILEDKLYPRRTLDADEIAGMTSDPTCPADSPDLGPPPVVSFENGDPIKFGAEQRHDGVQPGVENVDDLASTFSANLETRRKRRGSSYSKDLGTISKSNTAVDTSTNDSQPLKSGAKRKLSARDDQEREEVPAVTGETDFQFNRKTYPSDGSRDRKFDIRKQNDSTLQKASQDRLATKQPAKEKPKELVSAETSKLRRALGEKSVNTDPVVSPAKISANRSGLKDKHSDPKRDAPKKPRDRDSKRTKDKDKEKDEDMDIEKRAFPNTTRLSVPAQSQLPTNPNMERPSSANPKTPAPPPLDIFSPTSTEGLPTQPKERESRDTPPPPDLENPAGGRPSRRPRNGVSYAEPNLRDKMRRPGKELVAAVADDRAVSFINSRKVDGPDKILDITGGGDATGTAAVVARGEVRAAGVAGMRTITIKKEKGDEAMWKTVPTTKPDRTEQAAAEEEGGGGGEEEEDVCHAPDSPLQDKSSRVGGQALPENITTDRRRRVSTLHTSREAEKEKGNDRGAAKYSVSHDSSHSQPPRPQSSTAATTIAALSQPGKERPRKLEDSYGQGVGVELGLGLGLPGRSDDIFDFHSASSPAPLSGELSRNDARGMTRSRGGRRASIAVGSDGGSGGGTVHRQASGTKASRRYSSVPGETNVTGGNEGRESGGGDGGGNEDGAWAGAGDDGVNGLDETVYVARRTKVLATRDGDEEGKEEKKGTTDRQSQGSIGRAERAASRRRSMML